jgi:hypothetical protein
MKLFRPTGIVLLMLSLMYLITYIDRVNVSTASNSISPRPKSDWSFRPSLIPI